jgi:hypothetical protein
MLMRRWAWIGRRVAGKAGVGFVVLVVVIVFPLLRVSGKKIVWKEWVVSLATVAWRYALKVQRAKYPYDAAIRCVAVIFGSQVAAAVVAVV